mmetsp:Transcript_32191/g.80157  ORF Transcript_32191/g.80157 Transcript_32191/m.80157 type:complete len:249 (-) Transcript_32191:1983-2729(-)
MAAQVVRSARGRRVCYFPFVCVCDARSGSPRRSRRAQRQSRQNYSPLQCRSQCRCTGPREILTRACRSPPHAVPGVALATECSRRWRVRKRPRSPLVWTHCARWPTTQHTPRPLQARRQRARTCAGGGLSDAGWSWSWRWWRSCSRVAPPWHLVEAQAAAARTPAWPRQAARPKVLLRRRRVLPRALAAGVRQRRPYPSTGAHAATWRSTGTHSRRSWTSFVQRTLSTAAAATSIAEAAQGARRHDGG